jgi:hypothetical protein
MASVFVSTFTYALAKLSGERWADVLARELRDPDASDWPCFRTIGQARRLVDECVLMVNGSTLITKARSRAAGAFLLSSADVWLSFDDDVYADVDVLRRLIVAARATRGLVGAPCMRRDGAGVNYRDGAGPVFYADEGIQLHAVETVGFGLVALHRQVVDQLAKRVPWIGAQFPALFLERIVDGAWVGEDYAFCEQCQAVDAPVHVLCDAPVQHAGRWCRLTAALDLEVPPSP